MRWHFTPFSGKFRAAPMRAPALSALALLALLGVVTSFTACSNQGEGEFCDMNNGSDDCQSGLVCEKAPGITAAVNPTRCCPIPPAQPTTSACSLPTTTTLDASTEVPDVIPGIGPDVEAGSLNAASADAGHGDASPE
jgi:hypothetical protein